MKLPVKLNFGIIKNKNIRIGYIRDSTFYGYEGILQKVIQKGDCLTFLFTDGKKMEVDNRAFLYSKIRMNGNTITISYDEKNLVFSGFFGFTMYDTYGFPIEMVQEILDEMDDICHNLDLEGCQILKDLQKELSQNTKFGGAF